MTVRERRRKAAPGDGAAANAAAAKSYVLEDQIGFVLRRAHQHATEIFNSVMDGFELTPRQFAALSKLHDLGPTSQNQLGRLVAMDPATTFGVASRLAKRNLVRQSVDPADARLVILQLTDEGHALVEAMKARGAEVSARTLEPLTREEGEMLCRLLRKMT
jgi:MarR family transcriptional regulator, lower aerobic nicotinate degradation pathway regulator